MVKPFGIILIQKKSEMEIHGQTNSTIKISAMKEPAHVILLMSTYGANKRATDRRPTERLWIDEN